MALVLRLTSPLGRSVSLGSAGAWVPALRGAVNKIRSRSSWNFKLFSSGMTGKRLGIVFEEHVATTASSLERMGAMGILSNKSSILFALGVVRISGVAIDSRSVVDRSHSPRGLVGWHWIDMVGKDEGEPNVKSDQKLWSGDRSVTWVDGNEKEMRNGGRAKSR
jgi:hypothetical protein